MILSTETALTFLSTQQGRTGTILPSPDLQAYFRLPWLRNFWCHRNECHTGALGSCCSCLLVIIVTVIMMLVHVWANMSQTSFWLLVDMVLLGRPWWSLETLSQIGKMAMWSADFASVYPALPQIQHHPWIWCFLAICTNWFEPCHLYVLGTTTLLKEFLKGDDSH